ncbi:MAG: S41 family peptidase [Bacteroidia bacterium]|nr:S41 family peptidase [Bacteroidia bacterium]
MKKLFFLPLIFLTLFVSCKKDIITPEDTVPPETTPTFAQKDRDALDGLMKEWYFWYKNLPAVTLTDYKDPYELMDALRYKPLDRWSFVADYDAFNAQMNGTFVGHGIRIGVDAQGKARIVTIYKNSPLYSNGLINPRGVRRGWIIKSLNGADLAPIIIAGNTSAYNDLIGPAVAGRINTFVFQTPRGNDTTVITTKSTFQVNSVMLYDTLTIKKVKTGHLVFDAFISPSTQELATAFAFFKAQDVKDLILDLRYNGGGSVDVAIELASYIAGTSKFSTPFIKSSYNDKKTSNNSTSYFKSIPSPLNLNRLVVITTRATASASEEVINGLKPHLIVTTIGDTTNGKPTGMNVWNTTDSLYIFAPVTCEFVNSLGQGGYYAGFAPAKLVTDDITHDFNDKGELCFKEAIYFLEKGVVSTKGGYTFNPTIQFSEKPSWMNNMYIIDKSIFKK